MTDEIEGPDEVDPAHLAQDVRAELLLRDPCSYIENDDGTKTHIVPESRWLEWSSVPLIADPANCEHGYSVCAECADSWGQDWFIKFFYNDELVWMSPDHPDADPDGGNPPIYNL